MIPPHQRRARSTQINQDKSFDLPDHRTLATGLLQQAYQTQISGDHQRAIELYQRSIEFYPSAEGHSYLAWALSHTGNYAEAIRQCRKAIAIDPEYGNPYNDIGAYLIELGFEIEAVPWLKQAMRAERYELPHYPWFNLGRVNERLGQMDDARLCYARALRVCPSFEIAREALQRLISGYN